jgi:hypothetical protein
LHSETSYLAPLICTALGSNLKINLTSEKVSIFKKLSPLPLLAVTQESTVSPVSPALRVMLLKKFLFTNQIAKYLHCFNLHDFDPWPGRHF